MFRPLSAGENLLQPIPLRSANEQDMASVYIFHAAIALHDQGSVVHPFTAHGLIQVRAERVPSEHADDQRSLCVGEGLGRPLYKLSKVEQENGLELILPRRLCLRRQAQCARKQPGGQNQPSCG